jgi:Ca2+-binding RTX toxin-like protein
VTFTLAANVEDLRLTGTAALDGTGNSSANTLTGNAAANRLDGSGGADSMAGGAGNDTYVVDAVTDVVTERINQGDDTVLSGVSWTLGKNVENLILTGASAIDGTGNSSDNTLMGNSAANSLNGRAGADTMAGGAGNDIYVVDSIGDVVNENANEGIDLVQSRVTFKLAADVENLRLTGTAASDGTGNALANTLTGNAAANHLDGGAGDDRMIGGAGDDTYVVDVATDTVIEKADAGIDTVQSGVSWTLRNNFENLTLTGTTAVKGTGNSSNNVLIGNSAANSLNGRAGADTMAGGAGDDTFVVDNAGDVVIENAAEGIDRILSSVTHTLTANVENLTLTGIAAINATGNALANTLRGNAADNVLDGGTGEDRMIGGAGDDVYRVDSTTDVVTERLDAGRDRVETSVTLTKLAANVEDLTLLGATAINGTGNGLDNALVGNSAANFLKGEAGNDLLNGNAGADTLAGGTGNDTYLMGRGHGAERVRENDSTTGNTDLMQFMEGVAADQIWFRHVGKSLEVSIIGTADKATVQNWYSGNQYHVEQFKTSDGETLLDSKVQDLVSAMASFSPPAAGQTTLPASYQATLLPVIAANWGP